MRTVYIALSALLVLIATTIYGLPVAMPFGVLLFVLWFPIDNKITLSEYGRQTDNIYISSQFDGDALVEQRARDAEQLLEKSGNKTGAKVLRFFYRDAQCPDETWEEFTERVAVATREDRLLRHKELNENRGKYLVHILKQKLK